MAREGEGGRGRDRDREERDSEFVDRLVHINRVAKVVKGGRRFGFAALVVVGDQKGRVGFGHGKAREVPEAIRKATEAAKRGLVRVALREGRTLHHDVNGRHGAGKVILRAAPQGTGIIAGGPMRAVFETLGMQDVVAKSLGSSNPYNLVRATFEALRKGRDVYIAEACWHCHSQFVRPVSNEDLRFGPVSTPEEYQNDMFLPHLFGTRRIGPDLIRESGKRSNDWQMAHLYDPRSVQLRSVMPSYAHLFGGSPTAPSQEARDLVTWKGLPAAERRLQPGGRRLGRQRPIELDWIHRPSSPQPARWILSPDQ